MARMAEFGRKHGVPVHLALTLEPIQLVASNFLFAAAPWGVIGALAASHRFLQRPAWQAVLGTG